MTHATEARPDGNGHAAARGALARNAASLQESATQLIGRARSAARRSDAVVRSHPWQAVGVVAVLGAAVGYLAARRPTKKA
jgi:ElaB/YqjD/DUF883 family membrane-anchored ribosome-binding protein